MKEIAEQLQKTFNLGETASFVLSTILIIFFYLALIVFCYFLWKLVQKLIHAVFRKIEEKKGRSMSLEFLERLVSFGVTFFFIILPFNWDDIGQSVFSSAAVLTAVIGFAAQDVIKDILAGIQISIYKPFDIGDRIKLDNGTAGIVENITMRHVVLKRIDTLREVIPNSKMNNYSIINYSYDDVPLSFLLKFPIGYHSDLRKAKNLILEAIKNSPYTIPGKHLKDGTIDYAPIYFIEVDDSALIMSTTVYYQHSTSTELTKDDVNTSVFEILKANGIEIPYKYMNVIMKNE
ncbi:MAG: mechanosensitive ion channel family protein [Anaerolineaceae bacterium]|nr:mechanosensitive ion channel family protein [Anaerolineaceae bacterium]